MFALFALHLYQMRYVHDMYEIDSLDVQDRGNKAVYLLQTRLTLR